MSLSRRNFIKISTTVAAGFSTGIASANTNNNSQELLKKIAERIGPGIKNVSFSIKFPNAELNAQAFNLTVEENTNEDIRFSGTSGNLSIIWEFKLFNDGFWTSLSLQSSLPINCSSVTPLWFIYKVPFGNRDQWLIPNVGENNYSKTGLIPLSKLEEDSKTESVLRGAFMGSKKPGVFVGFYLPQRNKHYYIVSSKKNDSIEFMDENLN